jgi:alkylmercury lyase
VITMTDDLTSALAQRLASASQTGVDAAVLVPMLNLLADGEPVPVPALAEAADLAEDDLRSRLAGVPDTEYDERGRILGQGLTLRPTRHRFRVRGNDLYTWCALDTLLFPVLLNETATIESTAPATGDTIRVTAGPDTVTSVEPETAVVSLVNPENLSSIRSSFCTRVNFYATAEDAEAFLDAHPDGAVMAIRDAHAWARRFADAFTAAGQ